MSMRRHGASSTQLALQPSQHWRLRQLQPRLLGHQCRHLSSITTIPSSYNRDKTLAHHARTLQCRRIQLCQFSVSSRSLQAAESLNQHEAVDKDENIAVLGGGITGLSTAFWLANAFENRHITLYESTDRLGGWMQTNRVQVPDGEIIFDTGPKTLRPAYPNGPLAIQMALLLGLEDDLLTVSKDHPSAKNRFIYYPDHLVHMPFPTRSLGVMLQQLYNIWSEPVFKKLIPSVWSEVSRENRDPNMKDESVASFIARRSDPALGDNLASAVFHGIYAGDISRLSARSILGPLWMAEYKWGSLMRSLRVRLGSKQRWMFCDDLELRFTLYTRTNKQGFRAMNEIPRHNSVFMFKYGIGQLAEALEQWLSTRPNVTIHKSTKITEISKDRAGAVQSLQISHKQANNTAPTKTDHSHIISTIPPKALLPLVEKGLKTTGGAAEYQTLSETVGEIPAVTVCVVNLYYTTPDLLSTLNPPGGLPSTLEPTGLRGFGYLIPAAIPVEQNPEFALGVQFDSDMTPDLATNVPPAKRGTKLTVMLGGHWWDGWPTLPSTAEAQDMAKSVLRRHLGITEQPAYIEASMKRDCIPQYVVGHAERLERAHEALWRSFNGRLRLAGSWYSGVGVNDCIRAGWEVAEGLHVEAAGQGAKATVRRTGLEKFTAGGRPMVRVVEEPGTIHVKEADPSAERLGFWETMLPNLPR